MKKKYFELEIKLILLIQQDVITSSNFIGEDSNDVDGDDPYGDF